MCFSIGICMQVLDVYSFSYGMKVPSMPFRGSREALLDEINFSSAPVEAVPVEGGGSEDISSATAATVVVRVKTSAAVMGSCYVGTDVGTDEYKDNSSRPFTDHLHYSDGSKDVHASSSSSSSTSSSSSSSSSSVRMRPPLPHSAFAPFPHATSYPPPPPIHDEETVVVAAVDDDGDDHDGDDDHHSNSDRGDDTPYDMPPPSDTPSTMGTSTPNFDDLALPRGNLSVHGANVSLDLGSKYYELQHGQLGKRYRDEY
jgi:hypothetical protein